MVRKALVTWGGWNGHEPEQCAKIIADVLIREGFDVELTASLDCYADVDKINALSLIVPAWTMSQIAGDQEKGLVGAVKNGVGIAGWHGGMCDSFRNNTEYQFMTGGQWVAHP
ncbi:MAG: ThuA domain-containing protein, partial [Lentisphaerae bacterium]|nr:ThuA domain-containing protein [Lentisphaerota bacterium]